MPTLSPFRVLLLLFLLHLFADFTLKGCLANLKSRDWWAKMCQSAVWGTPEAQFHKYRFDYHAGVYCHALYWTLVTFAPIIFFGPNVSDVFSSIAVMLNTAFHGIVDNAKANRYRISLVQDQILHVVQIVLTWTAWLVLV